MALPSSVEEPSTSAKLMGFPEVSVAQRRELVLKWRANFRSFRGPRKDEAEQIAQNKDGRVVLQRALNEYLTEVVRSEYQDIEQLQFLAEDLASVWPKSEPGPALDLPEAEKSELLSRMVRDAFSEHPSSSNGDGQVAASA